MDSPVNEEPQIRQSSSDASGGHGQPVTPVASRASGGPPKLQTDLRGDEPRVTFSSPAVLPEPESRPRARRSKSRASDDSEQDAPSFPEIVERALSSRRRKEADDVLHVVDHCLLKLVDMEKVLHECHRACQISAGEDDSQSQAGDESDADATPAVKKMLSAAAESEEEDSPVPVMYRPSFRKTKSKLSFDYEERPELLPPVKKKYIKQFLKKEMREADAFLTLPFVTVMFVSFCLGTIGSRSHFRTEQLHSQDHAVSSDIEESVHFAFAGSFPFESGRSGFKNIHDVSSIPDFWSWLNLGLLPRFFPESGSWEVSESRVNVAAQCQSFKSTLQAAAWPESSLAGTKTDTNMRGRILRPGGVQCPEGMDNPERPKSIYGEEQVAPYLFHNEIVAGMRMQQEYTPEVQCPQSTEKFRGELFSSECLDFGPYKLNPELSAILFNNPELLDHPNGRTVYLPSLTPLTTLLNITRQLENEVWFSPKTRKINILYTTYNPTYNTLTGTFIWFILTRSGHIFKVVEPITVVLDPYPNWGNYLPDLIWLFCVVKLGASEFVEISKFWHEFGIKEGTARYMGPDNFIDWLNVIYALIIVVLWGLEISAVNGLHAMLLLASPDIPGSFNNEAAMGAYFDQVETVCLGQISLRKVLAFYPLVIISGFMKPFSAQPRLGVMTTTLTAAAVDIIHFFFVFVVVFVMYSVMGMTLFGEELADFATFPRAATSTFHCLLGNFVGHEELPDDEFPLARSGHLEAALWLWSLCWVINLVMLNMLLAIVLDTYASVVSNMPSDAETITSQGVEIVNRLWNQVKWKYAPLEKVLSVVDPVTLDDGPEKDDDDDVNVQRLIKDCDDRNLTLPMAQAIDLIEASTVLANQAGGQTTSENTRTVKIIEMEIKALLQIIEAANALLSARENPYLHEDEDVAEDVPLEDGGTETAHATSVSGPEGGLPAEQGSNNDDPTPASSPSRTEEDHALGCC